MNDIRKLIEAIEQINEVSDFDGPELDDVIERWEQLLAHFNIGEEDMRTQWDLMRVIFNRANQGVSDLPLSEGGWYDDEYEQKRKSEDVQDIARAISTDPLLVNASSDELVRIAEAAFAATYGDVTQNPRFRQM